jgi:hypothetical protein
MTLTEQMYPKSSDHIISRKMSIKSRMIPQLVGIIINNGSESLNNVFMIIR